MSYFPNDDDEVTHGYLADMATAVVWPWLKGFFEKDLGERTGRRYCRVGVVVQLVEAGFFPPADIVRSCIEDLEACAADEEWLAGFVHSGPLQAKGCVNRLKIAFASSLSVPLGAVSGLRGLLLDAKLEIRTMSLPGR